MRPWIIVLSSALCAIIAAAGLAGPELLRAAPSDFGSVLLPHLPMLAVAVFGVYALCATLLTTGTLVTETLFVRHRLGRSGAYRMPTYRDWTAAFGSIGLQRLAPGLVAEPTRHAGANDMILQGRFQPGLARGEIARLHYIWLARSHFFSTLIVLTALVGLGLAQDHGFAPSMLGPIPTVSAILILAGLILLAVLGRIAIDVSVEPLIETISQLPAEHVEVAFVRRAIEVIEAAGSAAAMNAGAPPQAFHLTERLEGVIDEGHRALLDAVRHLLTTTDALGVTMRSSLDALKTAVSTAMTQLPPTAEHDIGAAGFSELQGAVEALTAVLERLTTLPDTVEETSRGEPAARRRVSQPQIASELRQLLQEIETAR